MSVEKEGKGEIAKRFKGENRDIRGTPKRKEDGGVFETWNL